MKIKFSAIKIVLLFIFIGCVLSAVFTFNVNSIKYNTVYAQETATETTPIASGACGTELTWKLTEDGTLRIEGEGAMSSYSYGSAPWYEYRNSITSIVVDDAVTSISEGAFRGCNSLKEITLPFVGASRDAEDSMALFGYIFGEYTAYIKQVVKVTNSWTGSWAVATVASSTGQEEDYATDTGDTNFDRAAAHFIYTSSGASTVSNPINYSGSTEGHIDYQVSISDSGFSKPSGTTWQYSAYNYGNRLRSYYYYIPTSLTKVTITDATQISYNAFMNCKYITEINLNNEITSIGDYAFRDCEAVRIFSLPADLISIGNFAFV